MLYEVRCKLHILSFLQNGRIIPFLQLHGLSSPTYILTTMSNIFLSHSNHISNSSHRWSVLGASLFFMPIITFFTSLDVGAVILSTDGSIAYLYSHGSFRNKVCITNPIKQVAIVIDPSGYDFQFTAYYAFLQPPST